MYIYIYIYIYMYRSLSLYIYMYAKPMRPLLTGRPKVTLVTCTWAHRVQR